MLRARGCAGCRHIVTGPPDSLHRPGASPLLCSQVWLPSFCCRPCPAANFGPRPTAQVSSMTWARLQPRWAATLRCTGSNPWVLPGGRAGRGHGRLTTVLATRLLHVEGKETQRVVGPWLPAWRPRSRAGSPPGCLVSIFKAKDALGRKIDELEHLCLLERMDVFN